MTSRERVLAAINHQQPDRVPLDMGTTFYTGISACALYRLRKYYGLKTRPIDIFETSQMIGAMDPDIIEKMDLDVVGLPQAKDFAGVRVYGEKQDFTMPDGTPVRISSAHKYKVDEKGRSYLYPQGNDHYGPSYLMPEGGYFFDALHRAPEYDEEDLRPAEDFKEDFKLKAITDEDADWYAENARLLRATGKAVVGTQRSSLGDPSEIEGPQVLEPTGIRGYQDWSMAQLLYPEYVKEVLEMWTEAGLKNLEIYKQAVGDNIDIINISGTDLGTQVGQLLAVETFRELYKPCFKRLNDWVHQNTDWKVLYHSCGAIRPFLDDFVDMGVDIINPVQITAAGMDAKELKDTYGDKLVFWGGGVDTQDTLPNKSPEQIAEHIKKNLDIFAPGGGYVFATIHNIMGDVPEDHIAKAFEAARNYNF